MFIHWGDSGEAQTRIHFRLLTESEISDCLEASQEARENSRK